MRSMVVVLVFSPFCIPICMLIRCKLTPATTTNKKAIQRIISAVVAVAVVGRCLRFVQCGDRPNYYFSCYMCSITTKWNSHAQTIRQWQLPDCSVPMSRRMQKSIYARTTVQHRNQGPRFLTELSTKRKNEKPNEMKRNATKHGPKAKISYNI